MSRRSDIIEVCQILAQQEHLKATLAGSAKGSAITGASALAGGLLGGPIGAFVGTAVSAGMYAYHTRGSYRSVCDIIQYDLTSIQRQRLASSVRRILSNIDAKDIMTLIAIITRHPSIKGAIIKEISGFLAKELGMYVK